jgi:hypothetical protein
MKWLIFICLSLTSCKHRIIEDSSAYALEAGQATLLLGSTCKEPMALGYLSCPVKVGQELPSLTLYFFNAAEYAVSDCELGLYKTGSVKEAGEVVVDLSPLTPQVNKNRFCLLRVEAVEHYPDPKDEHQQREIPLVGGFFIEQLDASFFPEPSDTVISWCYQVKGTNKGRRKMEACK